MYIKIVCNNQIHLYRQKLFDIDELRKFVRNTFPLAPTSFQIVFKDEEGDDIIIRCNEDLDLVNTIAQEKDQKSIKLFVKSLDVDEKKENEEDLSSLLDNVKIDQNKQKVQQTEQAEKKEKKIKEKKKQKKLKMVKELLNEVLPEIQNFIEKKDKNYDSVVHNGYHCYHCAMKPIVGIRYECLSCRPRQSICSACESKNVHHHINLMKIKKPVYQPPMQYPPPENQFGGIQVKQEYQPPVNQYKPSQEKDNMQKIQEELGNVKLMDLTKEQIEGQIVKICELMRFKPDAIWEFIETSKEITVQEMLDLLLEGKA